MQIKERHTNKTIMKPQITRKAMNFGEEKSGNYIEQKYLYVMLPKC